MSEILLEEQNPYESLTAFIEDDGRTTYLYLTASEESPFEPKALWLRNHQEAPEEPDTESAADGIAPLMHRSNCVDAGALPHYKKEDLDLVWFQEGNGVTLYHNGKPEAVIPPWSGADQVYGYCVNASGYTSGTIQMPKSDGFYQRLEDNINHWNQVTAPGSWESFRDELLTFYEDAFGAKHSQYFAVTDSKVPILAVVQFHLNEFNIHCTVGMARQHMPGVESLYKEPVHYLRREMISVRNHDSAGALPFEDQEKAFLSVFARLGQYPWAALRAIDHGHIFETGLDGAEFIFSNSPSHTPLPPEVSEKLFSNFMIGHYSLAPIFAIPATQEDLLVARQKGGDFWLEKKAKH